MPSVRIFYSTITGISVFASGTGRHPAGGLAAHLECTRRTCRQIDYKRGIGNYEKALYIRPEWKGKRLFLRFDGVNSIADVFINRKHIGEHRGGYGAFIFEITDLVKYGEKNSVLVRANNGEQLDIMPLVGDFNFYGGIYRDVHLLITDETCISPLDYASPGVYLVQEVVSPQEAKVCAKVNLSNRTADGTAELQVLVTDGTKVICKESRNVSLKQGADIQEQLPLLIQKPRLWNGCEDPFMYQVSISLHKDGKQIDSVTQPLGLRYYHTDPDKGFFLNGKHLPLHGVCRHQDRAEVGNALRPQHHEEDVALMREMGVNAIRLAHYPQATYMYDLMDKHGIVTWAEIPFVGPGGYADKGFVDQASFRENGKQQLIELIRQHYNHPSICFWGLFNELKEVGDNPVEYVKELNVLAKQEDPTRPTTSASNQDGNLNFITENIAWNRYDGWYGSTPKTLATFLDRTHKNTPNYASASVNMGQEPASIISRTHSNNRRLQAGGIPRTGRLTTTWRIGKSLPNVPSYGVLSFGTCSISGQLIVRKATVRVSTIKDLSPSTEK